jgi:hypothetical protein
VAGKWNRVYLTDMERSMLYFEVPKKLKIEKTGFYMHKIYISIFMFQHLFIINNNNNKDNNVTLSRIINVTLVSRCFVFNFQARIIFPRRVFSWR